MHQGNILDNFFASWLLLLFLVIMVWMAWWLQSPPQVRSHQAPLTDFSADRAFVHLTTIARAPHSGGTPEHKRVREYLVRQCRDLGLEVEVQDTLALRRFGATIVASNVKNVIARLPGKDHGRDILVVSHYDSEPNTYGASDDGAGVAAMLETIRALKAGPQLLNDVLFLFTDQEENGLLGAEAFTSLHPAMSAVEIVLNYESRGNGGVAYCFEVSDENGWMVRQFAKAAPYPVASSMAYEVYKLLPNDTDFTMFSKKGITGLNQANIDGFVNYHSMTDTPENLDLRVIQHHGENMLSLVLHLGTQPLENTKAPNINFFNPLGSLMIYYPAAWNIPLMMVCLLLFFWNLWKGLRHQVITLKTLLISALIYLASLVVLILLVWLLIKLVLALNPHYTNFYGSTFYNIKWYLLALVGLWLALYGLIYRKLWSKLGSASLTLGSALIMLLMMLGIHLTLTTASFVFYYPLILFLGLHGVMLPSNKPGLSQVLSGLAPLAAVGLWIPLSTALFLLFSLQFPFPAVTILALLWGVMTPAFFHIEQARFSPALCLGFILFITGLGVAQSKAGIDAHQPLQTGITYILDRDLNTASWISVNDFKDPWSGQYLNRPHKEDFTEINPHNHTWQVWKGQARALDLPISSIQIVSDTMVKQQRKLRIVLLPQRSIVGMEFWFGNTQAIDQMSIDGRVIPHVDNGYERVILASIKDHVDISLTSTLPEISFRLVERSLGIPEQLLDEPMPPEYIFGPGVYNNAVYVTQHINL